jgi:Asp-tRNA(Asn)/Glu-tRNA(Gln) amidotransferase A subunit family amidase
MPLSVQLVGLPAQDALVLQLAGQMERSGMVVVDGLRPTKGHRPAGFGD